MDKPKFSVVIPAFKQAEFLAEAVDSVLQQTYPELEVIVVNDASPDHTDEVMKQFSDPRVKYLVHPQNKGLPAARNTGMRAATGDIIALLDADDYFHPDKLLEHARFLQAHPEVGVSYNPRLDLNHAQKTIRALHRPKTVVDLSDLLVAFPFSPSDTVIRRECIERVGLFDEELINGAEDMDYPCRLALGGCGFASVDKALNYRRYHLNRTRRNMRKRKVEYDMVMNRVAQDPRCPESVKALLNKAISRRTLNLAFVSFSYEDTEFGQELLREVVQREPALAAGVPAELVDFMVIRGINNGAEKHAELLKTIFDQFPAELSYLNSQYDWAVKQGCLMRGARAIIWGNHAESKANLDEAYRMNAEIDQTFSRKLLVQLKDLEEVIGADAYRQAVRDLFPAMKRFDKHSRLRTLEGQLSAAKAFNNYYQKNYRGVQKNIVNAIKNDPAQFLNRGNLSIFVRSTIKLLSGASE